MTLPPQNPPVELVSETLDDEVMIRGGDPEGPIVLLLHGLGSHEGDLAGLVPHLPDGFSYVSPRGIYRYVQGFAWLDSTIDPDHPETLQTSATALERWIAAQGSPTVGAIGFSQGGILALQLLRRHARALDWVVQLSGAPFPAPMPGDAELARRRPPVLWGHGGLDPLFDEQREEAVREFLRAHTQVEEVRRPLLGHAVDEVELQAVSRFLEQRRAGTDPA